MINPLFSSVKLSPAGIEKINVIRDQFTYLLENLEATLVPNLKKPRFTP
jgi:hypothetical protein